jgi:hypothetical protein
MLKFKEEKDKMLFSMLNPILIMIYADLYLYAKEKYNVELVITDTISTLEKDKELGRVSASHREARAIDIRTKDIDAFTVNDLVNYINTRLAYKKYHYMSKSGVKRLAYYHTHRGEHIHLAIHKKYANSNIQKYVSSLGN